MTYTVSGGALNSTQTKPKTVRPAAAAAAVDLVYFDDLLLQFLDVLLRLGAPPVGRVERHLELVDVLLQLLFGPHEVRLAARLRLQASLHRLQRALVVLPERTDTAAYQSTE